MNYLMGDGTIANADEKVKELFQIIGKYREALQLIASPERPDGTFNRDRKSCQKLAEEALCGK